MASTTKRLFPILENEYIYDFFYRVPSNFLHGEIYSLAKTVGKPQNEKFWIIAYVVMLSFLFIESVDKKILNEETKGEIENLASEYESNRPDFVNLWQTKRQV